MEPKVRRRGRIVFMTDADEAAFSAALNAKYPDLVFAVIDTKKKVVRFIPAIDEATDVDGRRASEVYAWIQPRGWRPKWLDEDLYGYVMTRLANKPEKRLRFMRSSGFRPRASDGGLPIMSMTTEGGLFVGYDTNNREVRSFVDAVYRLLPKFTTNRFALVNPDTRKVVRTTSGDLFWAGYDCLNVCRTRRNHFIWVGGLDEHDQRCYLAPTDWLDHQG